MNKERTSPGSGAEAVPKTVLHAIGPTKHYSYIDNMLFERGSGDHIAYLLTMILHELRKEKSEPTHE